MAAPGTTLAGGTAADPYGLNRAFNANSFISPQLSSLLNQGPPTLQQVTMAPAQSVFGPLQSAATANLAQYTPNAMQAYATKTAQALVNPQLAAQNAAYAQQQALLGNLYNRQTGFAEAMAKLSDPNGQAALNDYITAANTMGTLGQGISGSVGQSMQDAASQAAATARGLTNQGQVVGLYDPSGLASTGYATGFAMPGQSLAAQAVSAAAQARDRSIAAGNQLGVMAANTQTQQQMAQQQNMMQLAAIRAQMPGIYQQTMSQQQGFRQNALEAASNLVAQRASYTGQQASLASQQAQAQLQATEGWKQNVIQDMIAGGYLSAQEAQVAGKMTAQQLSNVFSVSNATGINQVTGQLMPGFVRTAHGLMNLGALATYNMDQARAYYYTHGGSGGQRAQVALDTAVGNMVTSMAAPGGKAQYVPTYDANGKRTGEAIAPGTGTFGPSNKTGAKPIQYAQAVQAIAQMYGNTRAAYQKATALVQANPAWATPGVNGVPFTGSAALTNAKQQATNAAQRGGYTASEAYTTLAGSPYFVNVPPQQLRQIVTAAFAAKTAGPRAATTTGAAAAPTTTATTGGGRPSPVQRLEGIASDVGAGAKVVGGAVESTGKALQHVAHSIIPFGK